MWVIDSANIFKGHYHILGGTLNSNENYEAYLRFDLNFVKDQIQEKINNKIQYYALEYFCF